jgi:hypothetical protein
MYIYLYTYKCLYTNKNLGFIDKFKFAGKHNINLGSLLFFENKTIESNLISEYLGMGM